MKNKILICPVIVMLLVVLAVAAPAQNKVVRKTVKKVVTPNIAPAPAPKTPATMEASDLPPAPPGPPTYDMESLEERTGVFGWGLNADVGGLYLMSRTGQQGLLGLLGAKADLVFDDPLKLGAKIGLAEDALEYKVGLGLAFGSDINNNPINTIPLILEATLYLKEGSLFGLDPFVGGGINYNLYGTDQKSGGLGSQAYGGVLADFGFKSGKTGLILGLNTLKVENIRSAEGIFFAVSQAMIL